MTDKDEVLLSEQVLQVSYRYSAGPVVSRFLCALRDERRIYGIKCGECGRVVVPPRACCGSCGSGMDEWVEVGPEGTLENFTVIHYAEPVHPAAAPFSLGIILLDGSETGLVHLVRAEAPELKLGLRLRPVWAQARRGHILDIACFEPVSA